MFKFLILSFLAIAFFFSLSVVTNRNPVFCAFSLIAVFIAISFCLICLDLHFFAFIYLIIYVGAVAVLFLFVIMFMDLDFQTLRKQKFYFAPVTYFFTTFFAIYIITAFYFEPNAFFIAESISSSFYYTDWSNLLFLDEIALQTLAFFLYNRYYFTFVLCGTLLLLAIIGSILVTAYNVRSEQQLINTTFAKDFIYLTSLDGDRLKKQNTKYQVKRRDTTNYI